MRFYLPNNLLKWEQILYLTLLTNTSISVYSNQPLESERPRKDVWLTSFKFPLQDFRKYIATFYPWPSLLSNFPYGRLLIHRWIAERQFYKCLYSRETWRMPLRMILTDMNAISAIALKSLKILCFNGVWTRDPGMLSRDHLNRQVTKFYFIAPA